MFLFSGVIPEGKGFFCYLFQIERKLSMFPKKEIDIAKET